jgi:hypothetical protein
MGDREKKLTPSVVIMTSVRLSTSSSVKIAESLSTTM